MAVVSSGHVGVHVVLVLCLAQLTSWMSVVRGMRGVAEMCEMCTCLARGSVGGEGGEWMRGLGLGFANPVRTGGVLNVCLCLGCGGVDGVCGEWVGGLTRIWRGGVVLCLCGM